MISNEEHSFYFVEIFSTFFPLHIYTLFFARSSLIDNVWYHRRAYLKQKQNDITVTRVWFFTWKFIRNAQSIKLFQWFFASCRKLTFNSFDPWDSRTLSFVMSPRYLIITSVQSRHYRSVTENTVHVCFWGIFLGSIPLVQLLSSSSSSSS